MENGHGCATTQRERRRPGAWLRRHRVLLAALLMAAALPALLAPNHPVAVYGYLAQTCMPRLLPLVHGDSAEDLATFLVSAAQFDRYQDELLEDLLDDRGGKLFAIARAPDGRLVHAPIRTWNDFLPGDLPPDLAHWLDHKEIPFLGDQVALWRKCGPLVALGHYHPFGGPPSSGDRRAQRLSGIPEVVVANGLVPTVYLGGKVLPWGAPGEVTEEVFLALRSLRRCLTLYPGDCAPILDHPTDELISLLASLERFHGIDPGSREAVIEEIGNRCAAFRKQYQPAFRFGYSPIHYKQDPDKYNLLSSLRNVELWHIAAIHKRSRPGALPPSAHLIPLTSRFAAAPGATPLRALILSGQNNHNWRETTPRLREILEHGGQFAVTVLEAPETMTAGMLAEQDVIVSNWNAWGDAPVMDWPEATRNAFLAFVHGGKGFVSVHAGSSSFYDWPEYQELVITAWDLDTTGHGKQHTFIVKPTGEDHPITEGMEPFETFDELWHGVPLPDDAAVLATAYSSTEFGGSGNDEPILMVRGYGEGRCVNFLLGHHVQAMRPEAFATLLRRATEWAATGTVRRNTTSNSDAEHRRESDDTQP